MQVEEERESYEKSFWESYKKVCFGNGIPEFRGFGIKGPSPIDVSLVLGTTSKLELMEQGGRAVY